MKGLVLILDDDVLGELVETVAHGALDRIRMGHGPSDDLKQVVGVLSREYSPDAKNPKTGDSGTVVRAAAEILDRAEAARYAGRSPATIDRWRGLGLRSHKEERRVLIYRTDLEEYINGS